MNEPSDMERSRLLLGWLAARRAVDHCLSDLLAAGPAGERRVRESLAKVDDLETRAQVAFDRYRSAAESTEPRGLGADRAQATRIMDASTAGSGAGAAEDGRDRTRIDRSKSDRGKVDSGVSAVPSGDPRSFDVDSRNVMPLHVNPRGMAPAGREPTGGEPAVPERWSPRDRPRLNVVRANENDLARISPNTKSNQRHR
ncbi:MULTISPECIES: hypothetical protein [Parafrankia]|nr:MULTISPECIES: hypothetical protein [Parafrankia]CAI7973928.1 conserved hypothetical protein [Frankia sp. Hr75.2]SQD99516.1 conserved hypothetical protein [Parafrankia sp. Ea1.12]